MPPLVRPGKSFPLGAHIDHHSVQRGVNFSVYARNSTGVDLLLFDAPYDPAPARVISLDPRQHCTGHYWHAFVPEIEAGQVYAYRAHGPYDPSQGLRFDPLKLLLDPYGRAVVFPPDYQRGAACLPGDTTAIAPRSVVADPRAYNWEGDHPLQRPFARTVIYELHVGGFTCHPSANLSAPLQGTYAGLVEKIPYLQALGITAVELLPVFAFDAQDAPPNLSNYWGYAPLAFFAPHPAYSARRDPLGPLDEFRDMVKALHRAGIEVILDVVFNHTTEGNENGPTLSFKGLSNPEYYLLSPDRSTYTNYSGTGNTFNANHPIVRRLVLDCLHYWVAEMHVDGFRFDLASVLDRDENGDPLANPPVLLDIDTDPTLAGTKLIAEAWDAAGLYQVGSFIGDHWQEWNGKFRDDVRAFVIAEPGSIHHLPDRLLASPDLYAHENREPDQSINFVTCHDGFTLYDLVSYNSKHNEANGEANRDGSNDNHSWNHGVEGPTSDPAVEALRIQQMKNLFAYTLLSMGTPMLLMGDEVRRTQYGNNNAYCQDNSISWFDWRQVQYHPDLFRFVHELIQFRLSFAADADQDDKSLAEVLRESRISWHGVRLDHPDWSDDLHSVGLLMTHRDSQRSLYFFFNAYWQPLVFEVPPLADGAAWKRVINTSLPAPDDILPRAQAPVVETNLYQSGPRSVVVLISETTLK